MFRREDGTRTVIEKLFTFGLDMLMINIFLILFTAEESGLLGSQHYVDSLSESERRDISLARR